MINVRLDLILFDKYLNRIDGYTLEAKEQVSEILFGAHAFGAELVLVVNGVKTSLCLFQREHKKNEWHVADRLIKNVTKDDINWAKKSFMKSGSLDSWTISDLKQHFLAAKNDSKNPKPNKGQNTKSVDGMLEYLLSVGYIE